MSASTDRRPRAVVVLVADDRRCLVASLGPTVACDLDLVDRLLWLRLAVRRFGWHLVLEDVDDELRQLLDLVGVATSLLPR